MSLYLHNLPERDGKRMTEVLEQIISVCIRTTYDQANKWISQRIAGKKTS